MLAAPPCDGRSAHGPCWVDVPAHFLRLPGAAGCAVSGGTAEVHSGVSPRSQAAPMPRRRRTSRRRPRGSRGSGESKAAAVLAQAAQAHLMDSDPTAVGEPVLEDGGTFVDGLPISFSPVYSAAACRRPRRLCDAVDVALLVPEKLRATTRHIAAATPNAASIDGETATPTGGTSSPLSSRSTDTVPGEADLLPMFPHFLAPGGALFPGAPPGLELPLSAQVDEAMAFPALFQTPASIFVAGPPPGLELRHVAEVKPEPMRAVNRCPEGASQRESVGAEFSQDWPKNTTSVMLRNIPNRYTPEELLHDIVQRGFEGSFDFFYLPTDFCTKKNKGYAFVNLRSPSSAIQFRDAFHGCRLTRYITQKVLELSPAVTQGFDANVSKYLKHQAGRVLNPWFKPMIFVPPEEGAEAGLGLARWRCLPLSEENLAEHRRTRMETYMEVDAVEAGDEQLGASGLKFPALGVQHGEKDEDEVDDAPEDDAGADGDIGDEAAAAAMKAAVAKFLRSCGRTPDDSEQDESGEQLPTLGLVGDAGRDHDAEKPRAHRRRGPHRAGRRRRGGAVAGACEEISSSAVF